MIHDRSFMAETANNHIMLAPPLICQAKESLHDVEGSLFKFSLRLFIFFHKAGHAFKRFGDISRLAA